MTISETSSNAKFYLDIKPFSNFSEVADVANYAVAPDDWYVIIADIQGSTRAISEGRYKEVNMIGAACINAVLNTSAKGEIPYVFGGDGATLLTPPHRMPACKKVLLGVRRLAETKFDLSLRVGIVPVSGIHKYHGRVLVGKYQVSPGNLLATFSGGGIELAESWIKSDPAYLVVDDEDREPPDLNGLSCRWEPLASVNGIMLSTLMQVIAEDEAVKSEIYRQLIEAIGEITTNSTNPCNPVCNANMNFRWPPRGLPAEIKVTVGNRNRFSWALRLYLNSLLQWFLDRFDWSAGGYRGRQYRVELRENTDYRRFDDILRILLDCTLEQAEKIETMLALRAQRDELVFGLHRADSALMTCLVFNLDKSEHIHFVDGSDGGFTSAAKNLKQRK